MRDTEREAETQAEGEAGSMQGAWHGTRSIVCSAKPLSHPGCLANMFVEWMNEWMNAQHTEMLNVYISSPFEDES